MSEIDDLRIGFARKIEDAKKALSFSTTDEWNWYVDTVINPTIDEYTDRVMRGLLPEREDMHMRGMVAGMKLVVESVNAFVDEGNKARELSKKLEKDIKNAE